MPNDSVNKKIHILLVEDSKSDARLINEFLKESNMECVLCVVEDGIEALKFLNTHCKPEHATNFCPDIILLDLNLPRLNGVELLKEIKSNEDLRKIPVLVLTTSTSIEDIENCYGNYANCYIVKPSSFTDFEITMNSIKKFWFSTTQLPK